MSKHIANWNVQYNGKDYAQGDKITVDDEATAQALVDSGAVGPALKEKSAEATAKGGDNGAAGKTAGTDPAK